MSSKRRPSDAKLGEMLKTPHFGQGGGLPPADPITPTPMVLTLEQIRAYDRNPRRERNPRYEEIKESIRAQGGLNNPLTVTRRPGEEHFMVESGGNTRLVILNELFRETGDDTFLHLHVLFRPWRSETYVLAAHLIENEKRGDMLFIDKALAVQELKAMFEAEDGQAYSFRQLTQRLREAGYAVDLNLLSRMHYAVTVLLPLIPEALRAGMGRPQIARIRQIEKAFQTYWAEYAGRDEAAFTALFHDCLTEHNRPEWDSEALLTTLEDRFADLLDIPVRAMRLDIDALLHGREMEQLRPDTPPPQSVSTNGNDAHANAPSDEPPVKQIATVDRGEAPHTTAPVSTMPAESARVDQDPITSAPPPFADRNEYDEEDQADTIPLTIEQARQTIYDVVYCLATHYQLEQCVQASPDWGLGFLVDLPETPLIPDDARSREAKQQWAFMLRQWVWWMLYVCSEETAQPERIPNLPESLAVRERCLKNDQQALMRLLGQPAWVSIAYQLFADPLFPDSDFELLMTLVRQCRQLRSRIGCENEEILWLQRGAYAQP